jgi:outer membrane lipoprotein-sorting protein
VARAGPGEDEVEQCVRRNLPGKGSIQTVSLVSVDRTGAERVLAGKLYWKRVEGNLSNTLLRVEAPPDMRNSAYLLLETEKDKLEVFVYLPELERVRRITAHAMAGSLFGTNFSYEDFRRLGRVATEAGRERLPDAVHQGRPVYVLAVTPPAEDGSSYQRIVARIDRETCVPLEVAFYEQGDEPRKVVTVDSADVSRQGSIWVPLKASVRDLKEETETRLVVKKVEIDPELPDHLFRQSTLARGH